MGADGTVPAGSEGSVPESAGTGVGEGRPWLRGQSLDGLWENEDWHEYIFTGGAGTVLDPYQFIDAGTAGEFAMMRPLTEDQIRAWAPDGRPTCSRLADALRSDRLAFPGRGCGRCTVLHRDGERAEIGYWGSRRTD